MFLGEHVTTTGILNFVLTLMTAVSYCAGSNLITITLSPKYVQLINTTSQFPILLILLKNSGSKFLNISNIYK